LVPVIKSYIIMRGPLLLLSQQPTVHMNGVVSTRLDPSQ
jgi:hypothetical protein